MRGGIVVAGNLSKIVGTPMSPNKRIFLNIVATYGRSLYCVECGLFTRVNEVNGVRPH